MHQFRSTLHVGAVATALIAALFTVTQVDGDASAAQRITLAAASPAPTPFPDAAVETAFADRTKRLSRTASRQSARPAKVAKRVVIKEVTWTRPVSGYRLTGRFGDRSYMWSSGMHTGLDFAAPSGTPIRSIAGGVVKSASYDGSYGYKTVVALPGGGEAWYCHQSRLGVRKGQRLEPGQVLGWIGSTGNVTGPHLHLEVRHGDRPTDPAGILAGKGLAL